MALAPQQALTLRLSIEGREHPFSTVSWSPNAHVLAVGSYDGFVSLWNSQTGSRERELEHEGPVHSLSWSPDGQKFASASGEGGVYIRKATGGGGLRLMGEQIENAVAVAWSPTGLAIAAVSRVGTLHFFDLLHRKQLWSSPQRLYSVVQIAWSPDGRTLAAACSDGIIRLWDTASPRILSTFLGHRGPVDAVAWSPNGRWLASGSRDQTICIWDSQLARLSFVLEGHRDKIVSLSFSPDNLILASRSNDNTIRLWLCDLWETAVVIDVPNSDPTAAARIAFAPVSSEKPLLAVIEEKANLVRAWELNLPAIFDARLPDSIHYTNAKVVLVGDSSVGKTGLGLVLTGKPFKATESTHGRYVLVFDRSEMPRKDGLTGLRETLLWDLAGQPGYRMIHQLHLDDVVVALVVFDARSEIEPFSGVRYWARALRLAQRLQGNSATPMKRLLVAARVDRGGVGVSPERIQATVRDLGFDGYFETSAKEGWGIKELKDAMREAIPWDKLPRVSSTELFIKVKNFLLEEKRSERLLSVDENLYRAFFDTQKHVLQTDTLRPQFMTCLGRLEAQGLIRRLSFGSLILLKPELLDAYASMLVNAAKDEPDGLGSLAVEDVFASKFRMDQSERLKDRAKEKLLLYATAEELLDREIALKETSAEGAYFVFPSQLTRERPEFSDPTAPAVIFDFQGPVLSIYSTLAVRLVHSEVFLKHEMWKNAASYKVPAGGICGMFVREVDEGRGELTLFFDCEVSEEMRFLFEEYISTHLLRRALSETVLRRRIFVCDGCGFLVTDQLHKLRKDRGHDWVDCPVCSDRVSLLDREDRLASARVTQIPEMDRAADAAREREVTELIIEGKGETREFDVFLAHKSSEKPQVVRIAEHLKRRRLNPWLDKDQVPPGRWFQDLIQRAIPKVKSAAVCIGPSGLGKWQAIELRAFVSQCINRGLPVIPVLLPGVPDLPADLPFLHELSWIKFSRSVNEVSVLDDLEWGITGKHPKSK